MGEHTAGVVRTEYDPYAPASLLSILSPKGEVVDVDIDELGIYADYGGQLLRGPELIDWVLVFGVGRDREFARIAHAEEHPDWVEGHEIMTYQILHQSWDGGELEETDICPCLGEDQTTVTTIYGETYDEHSGLAPVPNQEGWATFACQSHVLAKMKFMGKGPNDPHGIYASTPDERHATIRMLRADYCGTGEPYTEVGTPLAWLDAVGYFTAEPDDYAYQQVEARWTSAGALCLNQPRVAQRNDVQCPGQASIPYCPADPDALDPDGVDWISINP